MTILVLPYPVSSNRYWCTRVVKPKGKPAMAMTYVSPEAIDYRTTVSQLAKLAGMVRPISGRVSMLVRLYPARPNDWAKRARKDPDSWGDTVRCIDLGNCEKVLADALNGIAWHDDRQLRRIVLERCEPDDKGARVEVEIEAIVVKPFVAALFDAEEAAA